MKKIIFIILLILVIGLGAYVFFFTDIFQDAKEQILKPKFIYEDILKEAKGEVSISRFTIYGKHLNFEGELPIIETDSENPLLEPNYEVVLKNNEKENSFPLVISENRFTLAKEINKGINLEKVQSDDYIIMLKDKANNIYYNLINNTDYHDNVYYTISNNGKSNKITFPEMQFENINYWKLNVIETTLPDDVYDIVIDPGHGGVDTGASNGHYHESTYTLDYSKSLRDALEAEGLKVKLTREEDVKIDHYGVGSRSGIPYEVKAKLMFSVHLNSSNSRSQRGVEIYTAFNDNYDYAKQIAKNIVDIVGTPYSNNPIHRVMDGVYMRVYSASDRENLKRDGQKGNFEPYVIDENTTYYYFIRETGGIMTKAFSDGRNPQYNANPYRNYNQGVEAYLCEIAYISQRDDLNLVLNNKDSFVKALKKSVMDYLDREIIEDSSNNLDANS